MSNRLFEGKKFPRFELDSLQRNRILQNLNSSSTDGKRFPIRNRLTPILSSAVILIFFSVIGVYTYSLITGEKPFRYGTKVDPYAENEIEIEESEPIAIDKITDSLILHDSNGAEYTIPLSSIPAYERYLQDQGETEQSIEIERTSSEFLHLKSSDGDIYVRLKYSCGVNLCSSLLIKMSKNKDVFTSMELGYGVLMGIKQSPNSENAVFRYGVNEGNLVLRNNLIPVNLEKMEVLHPGDKELSDEYVENAFWPITEYGWISDQIISIRTADIQDSEYDSLLEWYNSPQKTKEIKVELQEGSN